MEISCYLEGVRAGLSTVLVVVGGGGDCATVSMPLLGAGVGPVMLNRHHVEPPQFILGTKILLWSCALLTIMTETEGNSWRDLPADVITKIASCLPQNEISLSLRLLDRSTAAALVAKKFRIVHLSQPCPPREFAWRWAGAGSLLQRRKLELLKHTAASGVLANLAYAVQTTGVDLPSHPAIAESAAAAGRCEVLLWLHGRGCPVHVDSVLRAAVASRQIDTFMYLMEHCCSSGAGSKACWGRVGEDHLGALEVRPLPWAGTGKARMGRRQGWERCAVP